MSSKINHDLRSNAGRTIYMPEYYAGEKGFGNLALPNVYAADDAAALYPRGTKFVAGERVFYYGTYLGQLHNAGTTVSATNGDDLAFKLLLFNAIQSDMTNGLLVRKIANELSIVYQTTVAAARSNNFYSGGWVTGKDTTPADERMFSRYIVEHKYQADGKSVEKIWNESSKSFVDVDLSAYDYVSILELDQPVINNKTSMATTLMQNPWKRIVWQIDTAYAWKRPWFAGACMHNDPTATRHTWFQTYGPMFNPHLEYALGEEGGQMLIGMADGSISARNSNSGTYDRLDDHFPVVGYLLGDSAFPTGSCVTELLPMMFLTLRR